MAIAPAPLPVDPPRRRLRETADLHRFARTRDRALRARLIEHYLPLARSVARRFAVASDSEDLDQVAALGLVKAIDRFDPALGRAFSTYAVPTIAGEVRRHLRDHAWTLRPPRRLYELGVRVEHAARAFEQRTRRAPTLDELARETGCDAEMLVEVLAALRARRVSSLDAPLPGQETSLGECLPMPEAVIERVDQHLELVQALRRLPRRSRAVIALRFFGDLQQTEIARHLGISQMQVSRILREALEQLDAAGR